MFAKNGNVSGQTMPAKMTITKYRTKLSACEPANRVTSRGLSPALIATISASPKTSYKTSPQNGACTSNRSFFTSAKYSGPMVYRAAAPYWAMVDTARRDWQNFRIAC